MIDILLTGGAGFIGSTLADKLLKEGNQVAVVDNFSDFYNPAEKEANVLPLLKNPHLLLHIQVDLQLSFGTKLIKPGCMFRPELMTDNFLLERRINRRRYF